MTQGAATRDIPDSRMVLSLAWPLGLKSIMLQGIVVIDAWLVSALGEAAIAVLGLSAAIAGFVLGGIFAFSTATQIRVAQVFGTGDKDRLRQVLGAGLAVNLLVAVIGLLALGLVAGPVIDRLAHDPVIAEGAKRYLAVFAVIILLEAVSQCLGSYFNGCGVTRTPLYSYLVTTPVNVGVSIILIHGLYGAPEYGVVGAAIGSAIAAALRAVYLLRALWLKDRTPFGAYRASFTIIRSHLAFSAPIAATFVSQTIANSVCALFYATLPVNQFAALTLITPWIQVIGGFAYAWSHATGITVAQMLGRRPSSGDLDAFLSMAWRGAFVAAGIVSVIYVSLCLAAPWIYTELHEETRRLLLAFLPVLLFLPFPKGSNAICGQTLRAAGDTVYVMHIFLWSQWLFRVPATALLTLALDVSAVWILALLLGEELVKFPPFHRRLYQGAWKTTR